MSFLYLQGERVLLPDWTESTMVHRHVFTVTQGGRTKQWFAGHFMFLADTTEKGEKRWVQIVWYQQTLC